MSLGLVIFNPEEVIKWGMLPLIGARVAGKVPAKVHRWLQAPPLHPAPQLG